MYTEGDILKCNNIMRMSKMYGNGSQSMKAFQSYFFLQCSEREGGVHLLLPGTYGKHTCTHISKVLFVYAQKKNQILSLTALCTFPVHVSTTVSLYLCAYSLSHNANLL